VRHERHRVFSEEVQPAIIVHSHGISSHQITEHCYPARG
jgi:hypothetical protein